MCEAAAEKVRLRGSRAPACHVFLIELKRDMSSQAGQCLSPSVPLTKIKEVIWHKAGAVVHEGERAVDGETDGLYCLYQVP